MTRSQGLWAAAAVAALAATAPWWGAPHPGGDTAAAGTGVARTPTPETTAGVPPADSVTAASPVAALAHTYDPDLPMAHRIRALAALSAPHSPSDTRALTDALLSEHGVWSCRSEGAWFKNELMGTLGDHASPEDFQSAMTAAYRSTALPPEIRDYAVQHLHTFWDKLPDSAAATRLLWSAESDEQTLPGTALIALTRLARDGKLDLDNRNRVVNRLRALASDPATDDTRYLVLAEAAESLAITPDIAVAKTKFTDAGDFTARLTAMRLIVRHGTPEDIAWLRTSIENQPVPQLKQSFALILNQKNLTVR